MRGSHGRDYGTFEGDELFLKNGAKVVSSTPTEHGDAVVVELPDGRRFQFLHGTRLTKRNSSPANPYEEQQAKEHEQHMADMKAGTQAPNSNVEFNKGQTEAIEPASGNHVSD